MKKVFNCAVIGCGAISKVHIDALAQLDMCRLAAVCDISVDRAQKAAGDSGCAVYRDYKKMLSCETIDSVHILTPHFLHVPMALYVLSNGINVILEKPVGINMDEIACLLKAADKAEASLSIVLQNRYNKTTVAMKKIVDEGSLGSLISAKAIVAWHRNDEYYKNSGWRGKKETEGGGLLINQAIHTLDLLRYLGGEVDSLKACTDNTTHPDIEVEDCAMATLYYKSGARASFYATNSHGIDSKVEFEMVFERGVLRLLDDVLYLKTPETCEVIAKDEVPGGEKSYWGISHRAYIKAFYKALFEGGHPETTAEDAAATNEMVLGIYESSESGEKYYMTEGYNE